MENFTMKKKVLISLILLAIIGTSAAFAQQATLDKLSFTGAQMSNDFIAMPANDRISGAVVIPAAYNGKKVFAVMNFMDCRSITSVTIPASVTDIYARAFQNCTSLTSVTFQGTATNNIYASGADASFPGDLAAKYKAGGAGTYTRSAGGTVWTKQGGGQVTPAKTTQGQGKYVLEIYNISQATVDTLSRGNPNWTREDVYFLVRTANGTALRSKDADLSIEQARQKLVNIAPQINDHVKQVNDSIQQAQQRWVNAGYEAGTSGGAAYRVFYWIRRQE
jgi:predicted transglutaminase-like cysteine proteinase